MPPKRKTAQRRRRATQAPKAVLQVKETVQVKRSTRRGKTGKPATRALSPCVVDYAEALADPENAPLACVPSEFPPLPSFKVRCFAKGNASVGSAGFGFVAVDPKSIVSNNTNAVFASGAAYAGTTVSGAAANIFTTFTNSPLAAASFGAGAALARFRLVGCALEAWYIGSELNCSGEAAALRAPDNQTLVGIDFPGILAFPTSKRVAVTTERKRISVRWLPTDPTDVEYSPTVGGAPSMAIVFNGLAGTAAWMAWEVWGIFEAVGQNVPNRSLSHADPEGFSAVLNAASALGDSVMGPAKRMASELIRLATAEMGNMSGHIARAAGPMIMGALRGYVDRRAHGGTRPIAAAPVAALTSVDRDTGIVTVEDGTEDYSAPSLGEQPTQPVPPHSVTQPGYDPQRVTSGPAGFTDIQALVDFLDLHFGRKTHL